MKTRMRKGGFTLIELMTVVIIVGVLAAIAIPLYRGQVIRAKAAEGEALLGAVLTGQRVHYAEKNGYTIDKDLIGVDGSGNKYFTDYTVELIPGGFLANTTGDGITVTMQYTGGGGKLRVESGGKTYKDEM